MKNKELIDLYMEIEYLLATRKETRFCLALTHNKKILKPVIEAITESQHALLDEEKKKSLTQYQKRVDETLRAFAIKDEKGEPQTDGHGGFIIGKNNVESIGKRLEEIKNSFPEIKEYLAKVDEIDKQDYEKEIPWYFIKSEYLPDDLGKSVEVLFSLIKD